MNQTDFESTLRAEGYQETREGAMAADRVNPEHTHDFDARVLVLDGEIAIACGGVERTYRSGDMFAMAAGTPHAERCGPNGVRYFVGCRHPQGGER